jgi:hypothetical protein
MITTTQSYVQYQGNGVTTSFPFGFLVPAASNLVVTITNNNVTPPVSTVLSASQYAVSGIGNAAGGSVTCPASGSPLPPGWTITIQRVLPLQQNTSLANQGAFYPQVVEGALDYVTMIAQQIEAQLTGELPAVGPAGINWRGVYSPTTYYSQGDGVSYGSQNYVALVAGVNLEPDTHSQVWALVETGPQGPQGPPNVLSIGTVATGGSPGSSAAANITGASPGQVLNLTIPTGAQGPAGATGATGPTGPQGQAGAGAPNTGTWAPTLNFGAQNTGITYNSQSGQYTAFGNLVVAYFSINLSSKGSATGQAAVGGLPVMAASTNNPAAGNVIAMTSNMSGLNGPIIVYPSGSRLFLMSQGSGSTTNLTDANFTNTSVLSGVITYFSS